VCFVPRERHGASGERISSLITPLRVESALTCEITYPRSARGGRDVSVLPSARSGAAGFDRGDPSPRCPAAAPRPRTRPRRTSRRSRHPRPDSTPYRSSGNTFGSRRSRNGGGGRSHPRSGMRNQGRFPRPAVWLAAHVVWPKPTSPSSPPPHTCRRADGYPPQGRHLGCG
jgi:hypothetical protein